MKWKPFLLMAAVSLTAGCVRQSDFALTQPGLQQRRPPFHAEPGAEISSDDPLTFSGLAAGTPMLVHVQSSLSSALATSGDSFHAVLDQPILLSGKVIAPKGAQVTGKILQAKATDRLSEAGYLRLTLTSITLDGKLWPLQSSHVFVKGATYQRELSTPAVRLAGSSRASIAPLARSRSVVIHEDAAVPSDRLLSFRLAQVLASENAGGK